MRTEDIRQGRRFLTCEPGHWVRSSRRRGCRSAWLWSSAYICLSALVLGSGRPVPHSYHVHLSNSLVLCLFLSEEGRACTRNTAPRSLCCLDFKFAWRSHRAGASCRVVSLHGPRTCQYMIDNVGISLGSLALRQVVILCRSRRLTERRSRCQTSQVA